MYDVVVVGAGVAGLSAAVRLALADRRVLVLEARSILGGRTATFVDSRSGEPVDNGQHLLVGAYHETFAFLRSVRAEDRVRLQTHLEVPYVDLADRRTRLSCRPLPAPWHLLAGLLEWEALDWSDRLAALNIARPLRVALQRMRGESAKLAASPGETVEAWLVRNGQTARLRSLFWEPLALATLNQPASVVAAPVFVDVLARLFAGEPRDAALGMPTCPLGELFGEPARVLIEEQGGLVRTRAAARVIVGKGRVERVEIGAEVVRADQVVAAVPWYALPRLFGGETQPLAGVIHAATRTASVPIVTVNVWLDGVGLPDPIVSLPGRRFQWVFDRRPAASGHGPSVALVASGAADLTMLSNTVLSELAVNDLCEAFPEIHAARVRRRLVVRQPRATFSLAPGQPSRPSTRTAVRGLLLAGDWIDTGLPATIESAVVSGHRAADAAMAC